MLRVGVDTGGTFTDVVFRDGDDGGRLKILSTPNDPAEAVLASASLHTLAQNTTEPSVKPRAGTQQLWESQPRMNRLIVKFRDDGSSRTTAQSAASGPERVQALNHSVAMAGRTTTRALSYLTSVSQHTHVAQTSAAMGHAELKALAQTVALDPRVEYAEVDERVFPHFVPNDSFYATQQGNLKSPFVEAGGANLPNAWGRMAAGVPVSGAGVTVAVLAG